MHRFTALLTKKIPHPTFEFGSIGASLSIEVELPHGADIYSEAERIYLQLGRAVDAELARQVGSPSTSTAQPRASSAPLPDRSHAAPVAAPTPAQPRPGRRVPAPVTASQLRLLGRLLSDQPDQQAALLSRNQVTALDQLTCRQASEAIDALKEVGR